MTSPGGGGGAGKAPALKNFSASRIIRDTLYGRVYYGNHVESKTPVVIKEYSKACIMKRVDLQGLPIAEDAKEEIRLHVNISRFRHPYIVQIYDVQEDSSHLYTVLEYCALGELFSYVQSSALTVDVARHYFRQLIEGVAFLHTKNVAHRDLSLENLLLDASKVLKICDFGVALECPRDAWAQNKDPAKRPGKLKYMAPEVFALEPYDPRRADVWSCGVILFVMLVGAFPYELPTPADERFRFIYSGNIGKLLDAWKRPLPPDAIDLLSLLLCPLAKRPSAAAVLKHSFLQTAPAPSASAAASSPAPSPTKSPPGPASPSPSPSPAASASASAFVPAPAPASSPADSSGAAPVKAKAAAMDLSDDAG